MRKRELLDTERTGDQGNEQSTEYREQRMTEREGRERDAEQKTERTASVQR